MFSENTVEIYVIGILSTVRIASVTARFNALIKSNFPHPIQEKLELQCVLDKFFIYVSAFLNQKKSHALATSVNNGQTLKKICKPTSRGRVRTYYINLKNLLVLKCTFINSMTTYYFCLVLYTFNGSILFI